MAITAGMVKELREKTGLGMMTCKKALSDADGDMELAIETLRKKGQATAEKRADKDATEGAVNATISGSTAVIFKVNCETDFSANSDNFGNFVASLADVFVAEKPADIDAATALSLDGTTVAEAAKTLTGKIGEKVEISALSVVEASANEAIFSYVHSNKKVAALVKLSSDNASVLTNEEVVTLGKDLGMQVAASAPKAVNKEDLDETLVAKEKEIYMEQLRNEGKPEAMLEKIVMGKMNKFFKENTLVGQEFIKADKVSVEKHIEAVAKSVGGSLKIESISRVQLGM